MPERTPKRRELAASPIIAPLVAVAIGAVAPAPAAAGEGDARNAWVDDPLRRARRGSFDGRGTIPCAQERGQALMRCGAAVARGGGDGVVDDGVDGQGGEGGEGGRDAVVVVTFPNGFRRTLLFEDGRFVRADATMSGVGTDVDWRFEGGVHRIRVDDQRYVLRDGFVFGD